MLKKLEENGSGVQYVEQELTEEQQEVARENIGAASKKEVENISVPTKTSQLTDDVGFAKNTDLSKLQEEIDDFKDENYVKTINGVAPDENGNVNVVAQAEQPTFVDTVEEMTDATKAYVLKSTGEIWTYQTKEVTVVTGAENKFIPSNATLNKRMSGSSGSISDNTSSLGSFITDYIEAKDVGSVNPYNVLLNWEMQDVSENKVLYYNSDKTRLGNTVLTDKTNATVSNGETILDIRKIHTISSNEPSNWSDVAYARFQLFVKSSGTSIESSDIENLSITFPHEETVSTKTTTGFFSTGLSYNATDYEPRIVDLEGDVNVLKQQVENLEGGEAEVVFPTWWEDEVADTINKIKALQNGGNTVTFPFFSDNHQRNGYAGILIKKIMDECNIPYCFYGGDSIGSGYIETEQAMLEQDKKFDTMMKVIPNGRFCRTVGNHDGLWKQSDGTANYYTREQIYDLFLREESISQRKHFGGDGTYYYIDDISSRTRFIVLNTNNIQGDTQTFDSTQLSWLKNTALKFNENGWAIVFISHQPISNHYHAQISNAQEVISVVNDYINGNDEHKADVVGWFSGHIHRDRIYTGIATNTSDDTVGEALPFTQVTIISDHTNIGYGGVSHVIDDSDQSHAIDFITINKDTREVNITRLGFGEDRSFTYTQSPLPYTLIPETTVDFSEEQWVESGGYMQESTFMFDPTKSYKVIWDGVEYVCDAVYNMSDDTMTTYLIGNTAFLEMEDNGLPFVILTMNDVDIGMVFGAMDWLSMSGQIDEPPVVTFSVMEIVEEDLPIYKCTLEDTLISLNGYEGTFQLLKGISINKLKAKQRIIELDGKLYTSEYFSFENGGTTYHEVLLIRTFSEDSSLNLWRLRKETIYFRYVGKVNELDCLCKINKYISESTWTLVSSENE